MFIYAQDPSLGLKNGYGQDDSMGIQQRK